MSNTSKSWYGASQVTKLGKQLTRATQPANSSELSDLEFLSTVTRSNKFAKQYLEQKTLQDLTALDSPRELLLYPAATPAVISRVWLMLEFHARIIERSA